MYFSIKNIKYSLNALFFYKFFNKINYLYNYTIARLQPMI